MPDVQPNSDAQHREPVTRLGLEWCPEHGQPMQVCNCAHRWGPHNSVRKYSSLVASGKAHPFRRASGMLTGAVEGPDGLAKALSQATVQRVPLDRVVATSMVDPKHVGKLLGKDRPTPRTGNHNFESEDMPTFISAGQHFVTADGHHRLTEAWAKGESHVKARVLSGVTPTFDNDDQFYLMPD